MKSIRNFALSIILLTSIGCCIVYMSCTQDNCQSVNCLNGGSCGGGICSCPTGWTGTFCETNALSGNWVGIDACDNGKNYSFSIVIDPSSADTTKFFIKTPHGYPTQVNGTRAGATTINLSKQMCDTVMLSGTINLSTNNALTFSYTISDTNSKARVTQCNGSYTRQ